VPGRLAAATSWAGRSGSGSHIPKFMTNLSDRRFALTIDGALGAGLRMALLVIWLCS